VGHRSLTCAASPRACAAIGGAGSRARDRDQRQRQRRREKPVHHRRCPARRHRRAGAPLVVRARDSRRTATAARAPERRPSERWLARFLVLAVAAKLFASFLRWRTLVNSYGEVGDASVFSTYGKRYSELWLGIAKSGPELDNIRKSNFLRWFTGVVYYFFGAD